MTVKNNPNRFAYIGCTIHSLDIALDEIATAEYNDSVCEILTEEERIALDRAYQSLDKVFDAIQTRIHEFGIHGERRFDTMFKGFSKCSEDEEDD